MLHIKVQGDIKNDWLVMCCRCHVLYLFYLAFKFRMSGETWSSVIEKKAYNIMNLIKQHVLKRSEQEREKANRMQKSRDWSIKRLGVISY